MIIIAVAIIAVLYGARFYIDKLGERKSQIEIGGDAIKQAEDIRNIVEDLNQIPR